MRIQLFAPTLAVFDGYEVQRKQGPNAPKMAETAVWFLRRTAPFLFFFMMSRTERELTKRQAALIDSAFEEGQYESGIAMLEQLCSPTDHPSR